MAIKRLTISVPDTLASRIKKAAGKKPVSAWVSDLVEEHLDDTELERQWEAFYREVNPSAKEVRRAGALLDRLTKSSAKRGAA